MLLACLMAVVLLAASIFIQYEALRLISLMVDEAQGPPRRSILLVVSGAMMIHIVVIAVWAVGYWVATGVLGLGSLIGADADHAGSYFVFSAEAYSSLGLGDINLAGPVRLLAGLEALTGLLMIAWSATFTFLAMQRFWKFHEGGGKSKRTTRRD